MSGVVFGLLCLALAVLALGHAAEPRASRLSTFAMLLAAVLALFAALCAFGVVPLG